MFVVQSIGGVGGVLVVCGGFFQGGELFLIKVIGVVCGFNGVDKEVGIVFVDFVFVDVVIFQFFNLGDVGVQGIFGGVDIYVQCVVESFGEIIDGGYCDGFFFWWGGVGKLVFWWLVYGVNVIYFFGVVFVGGYFYDLGFFVYELRVGVGGGCFIFVEEKQLVGYCGCFFLWWWGLCGEVFESFEDFFYEGFFDWFVGDDGGGDDEVSIYVSVFIFIFGGGVFDFEQFLGFVLLDVGLGDVFGEGFVVVYDVDVVVWVCIQVVLGVGELVFWVEDVGVVLGLDVVVGGYFLFFFLFIILLYVILVLMLI